MTDDSVDPRGQIEGKLSFISRAAPDTYIEREKVGEDFRHRRDVTAADQ